MNIQALIEKAHNHPMRFHRFDFLKGVEELNSTTTVLQLILFDYEQEEREDVRNAIKAGFNAVLHHNAAPAFDNSHNWGYSLLCESIALIKNKESLWNIFSVDE